MKCSTTSLTFLLFNLMVSENRVYKNLKDINLKKKENGKWMWRDERKIEFF